MDQGRLIAVGTDQEVRERLIGRCQLWSNAAAAVGEVVERRLREKLAGWFDEVLERNAIPLVIILVGLIARGRSQQDRAPESLRQVYAETVSGRVRKRVDEPVRPVPPRRAEFGVLTAARVDGEALSPKRPRHLEA